MSRPYPFHSTMVALRSETRIEVGSGPNRNQLTLRDGGAVTLFVGETGDNADMIAQADRLIESLQELRAAALLRLAETEAVPA